MYIYTNGWSNQELYCIGCCYAGILKFYVSFFFQDNTHTYNLFTLINKHLQSKIPIHEADQTLQQLDKVVTSSTCMCATKHSTTVFNRYKYSLRT